MKKQKGIYFLFFTIAFLLLPCVPAFADLSRQEQVLSGSGVGLGSIIAVVASWHRNKSILLAIVHGFFGWLYVVYYFFTR
jgi:hypothetical protein